MKVVDLEEKSDKIQNFLTQTVSEFIRQDEEITIETSSFALNYFAKNSSNIPNILQIKNSIIQLPPLCDMTYLISNCSQQSIIIKVIFDWRLTLTAPNGFSLKPFFFTKNIIRRRFADGPDSARLFIILNYKQLEYNSANGCEWTQWK